VEQRRAPIVISLVLKISDWLIQKTPAADIRYKI
jgi:hypothetical protein